MLIGPDGIIFLMYRLRYRHILWFFGKFILSFIWWDIILVRIGFRGLAHSSRRERFRKMAATFRIEAIQMGGLMIKVGQFLSSRLDVLPPEITDELAGLQDEVRPEKTDHLLKVASTDFNSSVEEKYEWIDPQPLAAASIGQVHRAKLKKPCLEGDREICDVIIKIQRPDIDKIVEVDLSAMRVVAGWLMHYPPIRKRANVPAMLEEFSRASMEELDYLNEGKNDERFAENFSAQADVRVPKVVWSHTTRRVLTLEYIDAIKITDYSAIEAAKIDRSAVAKKLFGTYLKQVFEDRFFHADPHPGNLFILPLTSEKADQIGQNWQLVFIDFGMTGSLSESLMTNLREILIAVGTQDAKRIIRAYQTLGFLLPGADLDLLEKATNRVFERFWGKTAPELMDMHQEEAVAFVREFGDLLYEMPFQIPENILLLGRCVSILSGICSGLDIDFNVWSSIAPYAQKLVTAEEGGGLRFWIKEISTYFTVIANLPRKADALLNRIEQGKLEVQTPQTDRRLLRMERGLRSLTAAIIFYGLLSAGAQFFLANQPGFALALGIGALIALILVIFPR
jgi:predicted unusual protein kinase regulating ubiquinone biosynthesis (AarF/ABC1/UbiB family)